MQRLSRRDFIIKGGAALAGAKLMLEGPVAFGERARPQYDPRTDPLALNDQLRQLAASFGTGSHRQRLERLFSSLRIGGGRGISVVSGSGRPPRTAAQALVQGGDCTEFALLVVSQLRQMGIPGGAMVVHFESAPALEDHMIPYAQLGERRVVIDLQAGRLGMTQRGRYGTLLTLAYGQAAEMYHREWGDYLNASGRRSDAIRAYSRALQVHEADAYVHQHLSVLYQRAGDTEAAARHGRRAGELDQRYRSHSTRGTYNQEVERGTRAHEERRWSDCAQHFRNALSSGERISADERRMLEHNIGLCGRRASGSEKK